MPRFTQYFPSKLTYSLETMVVTSLSRALLWENKNLHESPALFFNELGILNPPKLLLSFYLNDCCTILPTLTAFLCFGIWSCYLYYPSSYPERKTLILRAFLKTNNNNKHTNPKPNPQTKTPSQNKTLKSPTQTRKTRKLFKGYQLPDITISTDVWEITASTHPPPVPQFLDYGMELPLVVGEDAQLRSLSQWNTYSPGANGLS